MFCNGKLVFVLRIGYILADQNKLLSIMKFFCSKIFQERCLRMIKNIYKFNLKKCIPIRPSLKKCLFAVTPAFGGGDLSAWKLAPNRRRFAGKWAENYVKTKNSHLANTIFWVWYFLVSRSGYSKQYTFYFWPYFRRPPKMINSPSLSFIITRFTKCDVI